jgi:hypothetical protein
VIHKLDDWWETHSAGRRYDRGPMYFWMMVAALITGISLIILGPSPTGPVSKTDPSVQNILAWILTIGAGASTFAASTGSRFWFPRWSRVLSYGVGMVGIPLVCASMLFYGYAVLQNTPNFLSTVGGAFCPLLALGAAINAVYFYLEVRRINRNVVKIKEIDPDVG